MPTYEYRCSACGNEIEVRHGMNDPDLVHCDACGADKLERLISWTSVRNENWQRALYANNPKEAFKGISAVDRSRSKRFGAATPGDPPPAPGETPPAPAPADEAAGNEAADVQDDKDDDNGG